MICHNYYDKKKKVADERQFDKDEENEENSPEVENADKGVSNNPPEAYGKISDEWDYRIEDSSNTDRPITTEKTCDGPVYGENEMPMNAISCKDDEENVETIVIGRAPRKNKLETENPKKKIKVRNLSKNKKKTNKASANVIDPQEGYKKHKLEVSNATGEGDDQNNIDITANNARQVNRPR